MKALICGDRNYVNKYLIREWLYKLRDWGYDTIIEGEARGADIIARNEAIKMGFIIERFPAQWEKYGRAAGSIRNRQMLTEGKPDFVLAFHNNIKNSRGTKDMLRQAEGVGVQTLLIE